MKYLLTLFLILSVVYGCSSVEYVEIPDENLAAAIRDNLGLYQNDTITRRQLSKLTKLSGPQRNIKDISGLQYAKHLSALELYGNRIQDISPLADLKKLTRLNLSNNKITDISSLNGLKELIYLSLEQNQIHDIQPIEDLSNLKYLFVGQNPIKDLSRVRHLPVFNAAENVAPLQPSGKVNHYDTQIGLPDGAIARLGKGGINVMRFSPDGTMLAVGTDIGGWLYDMKSGEGKLLQKTSIGQSNALAFSVNGRILASGGSSNPIIQLWDISIGEQLPNISLPTSRHLYLMNKRDEVHEKSVAALSFSKSSDSLLSLSYTGDFNHWDISTGKELSEHRADFDYEGVLALSQDGSKLACGYRGGEIWIGDATIGKRVAKLKGHSRRIKIFFSTKHRRVRALTFSTDGKLLASGSEDKTVQIWSTDRYKKLATLKGHTGWVSALAFSEDGRYLASGDTESNVRLWDVDKKRSIAVFEGHTNGILAMVFSPDGTTLSTGSADGSIRIWDVKSQKVSSIFAIGHTEWVRDISFSFDNTKVSVANYNATAERWDVETTSQLDVFNMNPQKISYAVALSPDGSHLACHNIEGNITFNVDGWETVVEYYNSDKVRLWNLDTKTELPSIPDVFGEMIFSLDNKILACKSLQDISSWHKTTDSEVSRYLSSVTVGRSKEILITEIRTGTELYRIHLGKRGGALSGGGLKADVSLTFSPEGGMLAAGHKIWHVDTWEQLPIFTSKYAAIMAFSKDSKILAVTDNGMLDEDIRMWSISKLDQPQSLNTIKLPPTFKNRALTLSPDGSILVESTKMGYYTYCEAKISLWDVSTGEKLLSLPGHTEPITKLKFTHDGKTLASGSEDGTVICGIGRKS